MGCPACSWADTTAVSFSHEGSGRFSFIIKSNGVPDIYFNDVNQGSTNSFGANLNLGGALITFTGSFSNRDKSRNY